MPEDLVRSAGRGPSDVTGRKKEENIPLDAAQQPGPGAVDALDTSGDSKTKQIPLLTPNCAATNELVYIPIKPINCWRFFTAAVASSE